MSRICERSGLWAAALALLFIQACASSKPEDPVQIGGESHFLSRCVDDCSQGLECIIGACTLACDSNAVCEDLASAAECGDVAEQRACRVSCEVDADCSEFDGTSCQQGQCLPVTDVTCEEGGEVYAVGEGWSCADGCNDCWCNADGNITSTAVGCAVLCVDSDQAYTVGESWPCSDGCNTCACEADGSIASTLIDCEPAPEEGCTEGSQQYALGDSWTCSDGCNQCGCTENGVYRTTAPCLGPFPDWSQCTDETCLCDALARCTPAYHSQELDVASYQARTCGSTADSCELTFYEVEEADIREYHCTIPRGLQLCDAELDRNALREYCRVAVECSLLTDEACFADDSCDWVAPVPNEGASDAGAP